MKKTVVIGVTGGIAAYKSVQLVSDLIKLNYDVEVIMTKNATQFIQPLTFEALIQRRVMVDTFDRSFEYSTEHISIAKKADVFMIVPATANVIAKIAHGLADDMLTTTFLAARCPKIIAPAMNTGMYENAITQENFAICTSHGMMIVEPDDGLLACGDVGKGKLASLPVLIEAIEESLVSNKYLMGKTVLITAGPTVEHLDPVRFITNHSSGKMGYALAKAARNLGAKVILISGPTNLAYPSKVDVIPVQSAQQMFEAVQSHYQSADFIVKSAAVGDYRAASIASEKIKKSEDETTLVMLKNPDILAYLGKHKRADQILCGFAMETQNLLENARKKLNTKGADMIVANDLNMAGAGFQMDTNITTFLTKENTKQNMIMSKDALAMEIWQELYQMYQAKQGE